MNTANVGFLMKHRYGRNKLICGLNESMVQEGAPTFHVQDPGFHPQQFLLCIKYDCVPISKERGRLKGRSPCYSLLN